MAKSPTERSREFRERQKMLAREKIAEVVAPASYLKRSFAEFMEGQSPSFEENLDAFGVQIAGTRFNEHRQEFPSEYVRDEPIDALQRASAMVEVFIDAAGELATLINQYKLDQIERAINEAVEASANLPRGDVEALKASFVEIDRLKAMRTELRTPKRFTFPAIAAKGEA